MRARVPRVLFKEVCFLLNDFELLVVVDEVVLLDSFPAPSKLVHVVGAGCLADLHAPLGLDVGHDGGDREVGLLPRTECVSEVSVRIRGNMNRPRMAILAAAKGHAVCEHLGVHELERVVGVTPFLG